MAQTAIWTVNHYLIRYSICLWEGKIDWMKTHTVVKNVKAACPEGMTKLSQMNKSDAMKIRSNFHYFFQHWRCARLLWPCHFPHSPINPLWRLYKLQDHRPLPCINRIVTISCQTTGEQFSYLSFCLLLLSTLHSPFSYSALLRFVHLDAALLLQIINSNDFPIDLAIRLTHHNYLHVNRECGCTWWVPRVG